MLGTPAAGAHPRMHAPSCPGGVGPACTRSRIRRKRRPRLHQLCQLRGTHAAPGRFVEAHAADSGSLRACREAVAAAGPATGAARRGHRLDAAAKFRRCFLAPGRFAVSGAASFGETFALPGHCGVGVTHYGDRAAAAGRHLRSDMDPNMPERLLRP
jgi:hypothetical protein